MRTGYGPWRRSRSAWDPRRWPSRFNSKVVLRPVVWFGRATERHYYNKGLGGEEGEGGLKQVNWGGKQEEYPVKGGGVLAGPRVRVRPPLFFGFFQDLAS